MLQNGMTVRNSLNKQSGLTPPYQLQRYLAGSETDETNYGSWFRHDTAATDLTLLSGSGN